MPSSVFLASLNRKKANKNPLVLVSHRKITAFLLIGLLVILDQVSKFLVVKHLKPGQSLPIVQHLFHITYVANPGAAFGLFQPAGALLIALSLITILVLAYLVLVRKDTSNTMTFCFCLILAGAVGNVMDRMRYGFVVDFLDLRIWPVFNIADSVITIGILCLMLLLVYHRRNA